MILLSIIIPFYKGEKFILNLMDSIQNSYNEYNLEIEVIIVLDSAINSEIYKQLFNYKGLNVKVIPFTENHGVAKARDIGKEHSSGTWLTFIDQDDYIEINYFKSVGPKLNQNDFSCLFINGFLKNSILNKRIPMFIKHPKVILSNFLYTNIIPSPSFLIVRKDYLISKEINFSDNSEFYGGLMGVDDWYYILQLILTTQHLKVENLKDRIINYCIHDSNFSANTKIMLDSKIKLIKFLMKKYPDYIPAFNKSLYLCLEGYDKVTGKKHLPLMKPKVSIRHIILYVKDYNRFFRLLMKKIQNW